MNANEKAVTEVLARYQDALNQSDTDAVMKLYAANGVFMPQNSPSSVGAGEVRGAYDAVFKSIKLTVKFNVAEVVRSSITESSGLPKSSRRIAAWRRTKRAER
jgi:ketosteroid isomerase-like protein